MNWMCTLAQNAYITGNNHAILVHTPRRRSRMTSSVSVLNKIVNSQVRSFSRGSRAKNAMPTRLVATTKRGSRRATKRCSDARMAYDIKAR